MNPTGLHVLERFQESERASQCVSPLVLPQPGPGPCNTVTSEASSNLAFTPAYWHCKSKRVKLAFRHPSRRFLKRATETTRSGRHQISASVDIATVRSTPGRARMRPGDTVCRDPVSKKRLRRSGQPSSSQPSSSTTGHSRCSGTLLAKVTSVRSPSSAPPS